MLKHKPLVQLGNNVAWDELRGGIPPARLVPLRTSSRVLGEASNLLIHGDNLSVLRLLVQEKEEMRVTCDDGSSGVRVAYFDPRPLLGQVSSDESEGETGVVPCSDEALRVLSNKLVMIRELLTEDGSIFVHADGSYAHYLRLLLNDIFGEQFFRNEIIWHFPGRSRRNRYCFSRRWESIFYYSKTRTPLFNSYAEPWESRQFYLKTQKQQVHTDSEGREYTYSDWGSGKKIKRYVDEAMESGRFVDDVWQIDRPSAQSRENFGSPWQKPEQLLSRIIQAASNPGDLVLSPFCGTGTALAVAEKLGRRWIGIDASAWMLKCCEQRLWTLTSEIGQSSENAEFIKPRFYTRYEAASEGEWCDEVDLDQRVADEQASRPLTLEADYAAPDGELFPMIQLKVTESSNNRVLPGENERIECGLLLIDVHYDGQRFVIERAEAISLSVLPASINIAPECVGGALKAVLIDSKGREVALQLTPPNRLRSG